MFSKPIAASRTPSGVIVVAGLVADKHSIVAEGLATSGAALWSVAVLDGVSWGANAALRVLPAAAGAGVLWRGSRGDKAVTQLVTVSAKGEVSGAPLDVGVAPCATDDRIAWLDRSKGEVRVVTWPWVGPPSPSTLGLKGERDPTLVCGNSKVFLIGEGEDDITVSADGADAPQVFLRDRDFPGQEEQEHDAYVNADVLGMVRISTGGQLDVKELTPAQPSSPWRRLSTKLLPDDDVVAVDADERALAVVFTREAGDRCASSSAESVHVARAPRGQPTDASAESSFEVAPYDCDRDRGPYWTGGTRDAMTVAWVERAPKVEGTSAPIAALAYRAFTAGPLAELHRIEVPADDIVPAGCDRERCYAVALVRAPGTDDMQPEAVRLLSYP